LDLLFGDGRRGEDYEATIVDILGGGFVQQTVREYSCYFEVEIDSTIRRGVRGGRRKQCHINFVLCVRL
jgi:hypothetical protein